MSNRLRNSKIFTMDDIAEELGISKSTVSRALSGSGRISSDTRRKVEECARQHDFHPNLVAKALAGAKTLNMAAVMPLEATSLQMMFFHECLSGMVSRAAQAGYTVLVCMTPDSDSGPLERIIENNKVDVVVLTQLKKNDRNMEILKKSKFPFLVIGSGAGKDVVQVDSKMKDSCRDFTKLCVRRAGDVKNVLFVCGSLDVEANNNRLSGFLSGMEELGGDIKYSVCTQKEDLEDEIDIKDWELILCSDDIVSARVLDLLRAKGVEAGKQVKLASFHDSVILESRTPSVSALRVDAFSLGAEAATVALRMIGGSDYQMMNYVDCSFQMRETV